MGRLSGFKYRKIIIGNNISLFNLTIVLYKYSDRISITQKDYKNLLRSDKYPLHF